MNRRSHEQGIALITTLIMLSVVTLMAVTFLAVSRRERASVTTSSDRQDARAMADVALQRAEAEMVSRVLATGNLLSYEYLVSTNYQNPLGFFPGNTNIANVNFRYPDGSAVTGDDLLQVYRNLQVDPRAPVFITTNAFTGAQDFRFFLDFNRNGLYETNGIQIEIGTDGLSLGFTNFHVGDPEWIGVLRRPEQAHSGSNHFVGRYAFLVLPVGRSLDLNFIHNEGKRLGSAFDNGYFRNQGVGPWELNLAAFLRDLNTNAWNRYDYLTNLGVSSREIAFDNARTLLRERYRLGPADGTPSFNRLASVRALYPFFDSAGTAFLRDGIDGYADGPLQLGIGRPYDLSGTTFTILENDNPALSWPGAPNPSQYFDIQALFALRDTASVVQDRFTNRLISVSITNSTYDRHTFYRLLGQLGTDSVPANRDRIHLNYDNRLDFTPGLEGAIPGPLLGWHATNFIPWTTAGAFFTNAADRMLKALHPRPGIDMPAGSVQIAVTNIPIWPTNYYSPAVHRALQLAANIYDATTNRPSATGAPFLPTVFRPLFNADPAVPGGLRIADVAELGQTADEFWTEVTIPGRDRRFAGYPLILGAKKGHPNFNEFELQTVVVAGRKIELAKRSPTSLPVFTNQLYTLAISNVFGIEFWNSYRDPYPRELELRVRLESAIVLSNEFAAIRTWTNIINHSSVIPANTWEGEQFRIPVSTNLVFLPPSVYRRDGLLISVTNALGLNVFETAAGFPIPTWRLNVTNRVVAALIDRSIAGGRFVDFVDLNNLTSHIDISRELFGQQNLAGETSLVGSFWVTNRVQGIPEGIRNQVQASLGQINVPNWHSASAEPLQGNDKLKAIERFRQFVGLSSPTAPPSPTLRMQAPFSPAIKLLHQKSWQANDPLVNRTVWDLEDPARTNLIERLPPLFVIDAERSNIGKINQRYRPWQRGLYSSGDATDFDPSLKDPQIRSSDDWDFPTNALPTIGWLGRVHRGTPWQTVYLKSLPPDPAAAAGTARQWYRWSGHPIWRWPGDLIPLGTHPTNDWRILDLFTTAFDDNASRGLLSVNQSGLAAWSAVFSGVPILTNQVAGTNVSPHIIEPNTPELRAVVDGINFARSLRPAARFNTLGEVLSAPELTLASPYLRMDPSQNGIPADAVVERIPQMTLGLLRTDEPRFVVLAYGQSLRPAPASVVTDFGPYFQMPTNYSITGEYVTKTLMRLEQVFEPDPVTGMGRFRIRAVKESYNEVPPIE